MKLPVDGAMGEIFRLIIAYVKQQPVRLQVASHTTELRGKRQMGWR